MADLLRRRYELMLAACGGAARRQRSIRRRARPDAGARVSADEAAIIRRATAAERQRLIALRADGTIGDAAFQQIEQELDLEELYLQQLAPGGDSA